VDDSKELQSQILPDTRKSNGYISVNAFFEEASNTFHLVEDWESLADQQAYAGWRGETGGIAILEPLLEIVKNCDTVEINTVQFETFWVIIIKINKIRIIYGI